jgi:hypothetical protein
MEVASLDAMSGDAEVIVSVLQVLEDEVEAEESSGVGYLRSGSGRMERIGGFALNYEKS